MNNCSSPKVIWLLAVLILGFNSCTPKKTRDLLQPSQALGIVLAEETARIAGTKKKVVIISPDTNWGPASTAEESFKATLKKNGVSIVATKAANLGDPMRSGEVGLKSADFFEVLEKFPDVGVIVSFAGAPLLKPSETATLRPDRPPLLVVATATLGEVPGIPGDRTQLARLLEAKIVQEAIIDGGDPSASKPVKTGAVHEVFSQHYRILRRPD